MPSPFTAFHNAALAFDIWCSGFTDSEGISRLQAERLDALVNHAGVHSPFYRRHYHHIPDERPKLAQLPAVQKDALMKAFNEWVTDRNVTLDHVSSFLSCRDKIGQLLDNRYAVWKSSGSSGNPGIFLHDRRAISIYDQLFVQRAWATFPFAIPTPRKWTGQWRMACITACEDHFAGISSWRRLVLQNPTFAAVMRDFSVLMPIRQLATELNDWQPVQIFAYPSALALLAQEQISGNLSLSLSAIFCGGESLDAIQQERIEDAFRCPVRGIYAASECDYIAFQCSHRNYHVNADWVILEPVDSEYRPVDSGTTSHSVLVTNLANFVQPIIRYELDDSVAFLPGRCPCGNPLPAITVEGRQDEKLHFVTRDGAGVTILPMAITTVLDLISGLRRFQIVQDDKNSIRIACEYPDEGSLSEKKREVKTSIKRFLAQHGLDNVNITLDDKPPRPDPVSGKFHQVLSVADHRD